jgi:hypothetical protein
MVYSGEKWGKVGIFTIITPFLPLFFFCFRYLFLGYLGYLVMGGVYPI